MSELQSVYDKDGKISEEILQSILKRPDGLKLYEGFFQVVVCNKDIKSVYDKMNSEVQSTPDIYPHKTGEEILRLYRSSPVMVKGFADIAKALGLPTTCDVPISSLPTPNTLATLSNSAKMRG